MKIRSPTQYSWCKQFLFSFLLFSMACCWRSHIMHSQSMATFWQKSISTPKAIWDGEYGMFDGIVVQVAYAEARTMALTSSKKSSPHKVMQHNWSPRAHEGAQWLHLLFDFLPLLDKVWFHSSPTFLEILLQQGHCHCQRLLLWLRVAIGPNFVKQFGC